MRFRVEVWNLKKAPWGDIMHLYQALATKVAEWRLNKYPHHEYPAIGEILEWSANPEVSSFRLRTPQV